MTSLDILNCEIGAVTSKLDHSLTFRVNTPEMLPSAAGELLQWHGRAARVCIFPHEGEAGNVIEVKTERNDKTPSRRLHSILFLIFKQRGSEGDFDSFYKREMEKLIEHYKAKLDQ
jgi:hypothetical protein